jgi:dipeptidyl-peptidase 4
MNQTFSTSRETKLLAVLPAVLGLLALPALAQDRLPNYPGYAQYQKMSQQLRGETYKSGAVSVTWTDEGKGFDYQWDGKSYHFDVAAGKAAETGAAAQPADGGNRGGRGAGRRGGGGGGRGGGGVIGGGGGLGGGGIVRSQAGPATSPDQKFVAFTRDNNLWIRDADGGNEFAVTTDGSTKTRVKYGAATIVYGEELGMGVGTWWSPDSKKVVYYRFDESGVKDYYVLKDQSKQYDTLETDPYPKAGQSSPPVELFSYDLETKKTTQLDVRDGKPFADDVLGYYVYRIAWSPDGKELLFHRMNRKQNSLDFAAANPDTGKCRVIVHEEWPANWVEWVPGLQYLPDHKRFIWTSERNGFKNFYLYNLDGELLATLTHHDFEVANLLKIDEAAGVIFYTARDGDNYMKLQLHRVGLDGKGDVRLTDPAFNHAVTLAPDNQHFIDVYQTHDQPPATRLMDMHNKVVAELAKSDLSKFNELGLKKVELVKFKTLDGTAELHGMLNFPSNFDPKKKYPLLLSVYGGPITSAARETFSAPNATTEYGFLVATFDSRSLSGRGRKFSDPFYGHLGIIEMDDQAAGVKELLKRPYVDKNRVGVFGTSYGGTASATLILRYPDLFQAACDSSGPSDYRNYNDIYGERYEGLVSENKEGYDAATLMTYVPNLKGALMIYYGTADNNVHNSSAMQFIAALQRAGKHFEVQVGPDQGHSGINQARMMEFFIENLVMK